MTAMRLTLAWLLSAMCLQNLADASELEIEARAVTKDLVRSLGAELKKAIKESGPDEAISACREVAPRLAGELSRKTGWRVTRVSLRPRNPLLGSPDAWERQILKSFDQMALVGGKSEEFEASEIIDESGERYFRYMKALPVQALCLTCHGSNETLSKPVHARLALDYPNDQGTGYKLGEIRGAVSIKQPLPQSR